MKDIEADVEQAQESSTENVNKRPEVFKNNFHEAICILIFTFAVACTSISVGSFQISLNKLSEDFNVFGGQLTWSISSINLANGALLLLTGSLSDHIGRRKCIICGFISFAIFALIGGFMKSFVAVVVFRALMGACIAFCVPASGGILGSIYQNSIRKNRAMACYAAGAPLGFCGGILCGGICAQFLSWRAIHYFLAIVYGILSVCAWFFVPDDNKDNDRSLKKIMKELKKLDYFGAFLSLAGLTLTLFALTESGIPITGWDTPYIIATIVVGLVLIVAFVVYEIYIPNKPLMPMYIWKKRNFSLAMVQVFLSWMCFQGVLTYYSILYFEQIRNYSPLLTTACMIPMAICGLFMNFVAALILHRVKGNIILTFSSAAFLAASLLFATMSQHESYWRRAFEAFCFAVMGADLTFNVVNMITVNSVPAELQSTAQGIFQTVIQISTSFGLALSTTIVTKKFPPFAGSVNLKDPHEVQLLFHSFKYAYYFAIGASALATVTSIFVKVGTTGRKNSSSKSVSSN